MQRRVNYVRFHAELYAPGNVGVLGNVLPAINKTIQNLNMTINDSGLLVTGHLNGDDFELFIPHGNIVMARLDKDTAKVQPIKKVS
jgi:hypothetical protein